MGTKPPLNINIVNEYYCFIYCIFADTAFVINAAQCNFIAIKTFVHANEFNRICRLSSCDINLHDALITLIGRNWW